MFTINSCGLFLLGRVAFKYSQSIIQSMFLQLTPFASYLVLTLVYRINPENMVILSYILMSTLIIKYFQYDTNLSKPINKYIIAFAIVTGFSVAVKITFFPIFFMPFFLFRGFVKKVIYSILSVFSFLLFILPVIIYRYRYFHNWIKNLFIHSGKYGDGAANIIDKNAYLDSLQTTFSFEYLFSISLFIFIVTCIIYQIPFIKARIKNEKYYKALLGITVSMILMILLVAKQFAVHYLTPALLPVAFGLWIVTGIYYNKLKRVFKNISLILFIIIFMSFDYYKIKKEYPLNMQEKSKLMKAYDFINQHPSDRPLIIVPTYYGCPYQQYSLFFGLYWGGEIMKPKYIKVLNEIYPNTYFYNGWDELFHDWQGNPYSYFDILNMHKSIRLYAGDADIEKNILPAVMFNFIRKTDTKTVKIFSNEDTNENIYDIDFSPAPKVNTAETSCNADSLSSDKTQFVGNNGQYFGNGITQSSDKSRSGKYSAKITKDNSQGMDYVIGEVKENEHFKISVWRHKSNKEASLILAARNSADLYICQVKVSKEEKDWEELVIDYMVTKDMENKEIRIYAFNNNDNPAYFDDLEIIKY